MAIRTTLGCLEQLEYGRNFIFKRSWPIRSLFRGSCELGLYRLTADPPAGGAARIVTVRVARESGPGVLRRSFAGGENLAAQDLPILRRDVLELFLDPA